MKTKLLFSTLWLLTFVSAQATIRTVRLKAGLTFSRELKVEDRRVGGFRIPFITGTSHEVHIKGAFVDVADRVEIYDAANANLIRTIRSLEKFAEGDPREGNLKFTISGTDLPGVDQNFVVRIRYAIETSGYDRFDAKVTAKGIITRIEWQEPLPLRQEVSSTGRETSYIRANTDYTVKLTGGPFGNQLQFKDGIDKVMIGTLRVVNASVNSAGTEITCTFNTGSNANATDVAQRLDFAFGGIGNLPGGWGDYVFHRLVETLPTAGNATNLARLDQVSDTDLQPNIALRAVRNKFTSPDATSNIQLNPADATQFRLCPASPVAGRITQRTIPDMLIDVENTSLVAIGGFQIRLRRGTETRLINVAGLAPLEKRSITVNRPESRVCVFETSSGCQRCNQEQAAGLASWTDAGWIIEVNPNGAIAEINRNDNTLQI